MSDTVTSEDDKERNFEDVELDDRHSKENITLLEKEPKEAKRKDSQKGSRSSPFENASLFSRYISVWWMNSLFVLGNQKPLEEEDLCGPPNSDSTESLCDRLERSWEKQLYDNEGNRKASASLVWALVHTFGARYILYGLFVISLEGVRIAQPVFIGLLIRFFSIDSGVTRKEAYFYAMGLTLCSVLMTLNMTPFTLLRQKTGMDIRVSVTALVYKKVLKLSNAAMASTTSGYIVNMVSTDAQRLDFACLFLHYLVIGPVVVLVVTYLLWREIQWSCLAGIGLLLLLAPIQMAMGRILMRFRREIVQFTDERVKIMNEIISGIRVIKLYTWENSFTELITKLRRNELKAVLKLSYFRAGFMSFFFSSASLISFVTFLTYVLTGNLLTAQKVFTCIALFNSARVVMTMYFPIGVTLFNEGLVSIERLQKFLLLPDIKKLDSMASNLRPKPADCKVELTNVSANWTEGLKTLSNINLRAESTDLVAVVGPVGSGKSSLLMAILGELPAESGNIVIKGKIAYAPQQSWIFNGTLRYNITCGQEYDEEKYQRVLKVCALKKDLDLLPDGDLTLVGERGVALSGGQQARVNLARAVYVDADIYIMDDPLSAVDAHVGRILFDDCINGYLSRKLRILVTHQLQYLRDADTILVLDEGDAVASGTFYELAESGVDFMSIVDEEEPVDSAIEVDKEDDHEARNRRFSRQMSCNPRAPTKLASTPLLKRFSSFTRQESSFRDSRMMQSEIGLAQETQEVEVFEEKELPRETKMGGAVNLKTYKEFFKSGYGLVVWFFVTLLYIICQGIYLTADWWLSYWSNKEEKFIYTNQTIADRKALNRERDLSIYSGLVVALLILGVSRAFLFFRVILKSCESLHTRMFSAVLRAPVYFFDTVSIGRILNRFSKDMSLVDDMLAFTMFDLFQTSLMVIGILILVSANNPLVFAMVVPLVVIFYFLRRYYIKTAREVKRIEGITRSPVFGHFSTTLLGLPTIRAFGAEPVFTDLFYKYQDAHSGAWFTFLGCASWLSFRLDILCILFIGAVAFISIAVSGQLNPGIVGLILSYTINITGVFQQCIRQSTEVENQMTSVERILEYSDLEPEFPPETDHRPPEGWPSRGSISFKNMSFSYHSSMPEVLHDISLQIRSTEKIGVCGRTGAGKSSLLSTLFRTSEPKGSILIDGENILDMGLRDLRSKISIIPQDPVLFSGTMRKNLDPFNDHTDLEVWKALEEVQLKDVVLGLPGKLESEMAESGSNLSVGQRQLVCLARAILRRNKILVIDEATANVDPITDNLIQSTIREKFKDCTVLTIAHRLNTIMDSDRIMVLDAGKLKEFREPYSLLRCKNSLLYGLVAQTGSSEAQKLFDMARKAYYGKHNKETPAVMAPDEKMGALDNISDVDDQSLSPLDKSAPTLELEEEEKPALEEDKEDVDGDKEETPQDNKEDTSDTPEDEGISDEMPLVQSQDADDSAIPDVSPAADNDDINDDFIDADVDQPLIVKIEPSESADKNTSI